MNLLDSYQCIIPSRCLITDDPYRVKMIAAHYLEQVEIFTETRGQVGLIGEFQKVPIAVLSAGIGKTSTMAYINEVCLNNQIKRLIYLGDCITQDTSLLVGSVLYINKAFENGTGQDASKGLLQTVKTIVREKGIAAFEAVTTTKDDYLINKKYAIEQEAKILDFTTSAIYGLNKIYSNIDTLAILTVCENISANETLGEAIRQSGGHTSIKLALETVIS